MKLLLLSLLFSFSAHAATPSAFGVRTVYSTTNVTTSAWVQLVASLPFPIGTVTIFDSCAQTLQIGVGPSGSEVSYFYLPPGGGSFPLSVSAGNRISIRAVSGNCTAANTENDMNFFSN